MGSRYYDPQTRRFINPDGYVSTGTGFDGYNMYAYCNNNPVMHSDPSGESFFGDMWSFVQDAYAGTVNTIKELIPVYAGGLGSAAADGPLPFGDIFAAGITTVATAAAVGVGICTAVALRLNSNEKDDAKVEEKEKDITVPLPSPTVIYRYGGTNPGNLTPKEKDLRDGRGLSFSTIPVPGCSMTTIEALNATGIVYAVQDGATHVSVYPVGGTMSDWVSAGSSSIWTQAVKSVIIKWDGVS